MVVSQAGRADQGTHRNWPRRRLDRFVPTGRNSLHQNHPLLKGQTPIAPCSPDLADWQTLAKRPACRARQRRHLLKLVGRPVATAAKTA